jgi:hypothetical protein
MCDVNTRTIVLLTFMKVHSHFFMKVHSLLLACAQQQA